MHYNLVKRASRAYLEEIANRAHEMREMYDCINTLQQTPFIVNKCLAPFPDTIMLVNEINQRHHLDKKLQFDFLLNSIRPRKRFTKWAKAKKIKDIEYVKEYYGYSNEKAKSALDILDDEQLETIKRSLNKGGRNGR